jgi:hypothetical protein
MWSELVLTPWHNNSRICTVPNNCKKTKSQKQIKIKFSINVLALASASWIICTKSSKFLITNLVLCQPMKHEKHRRLSVIRLHGAALVVSAADVHVRPHWPLFLPQRRRGPSWIPSVFFAAERSTSVRSCRALHYYKLLLAPLFTHQPSTP